MLRIVAVWHQPVEHTRWVRSAHQTMLNILLVIISTYLLHLQGEEEGVGLLQRGEEEEQLEVQGVQGAVVTLMELNTKHTSLMVIESSLLIVYQTLVTL